jgi:TRAP-type mannitol/chloroaromatic compound transport system permease large subunit
VLLDIYKGVVPFIILQLIGLLIVAFWPQLVVWLPSVAYGG